MDTGAGTLATADTVVAEVPDAIDMEIGTPAAGAVAALGAAEVSSGAGASVGASIAGAITGNVIAGSKPSSGAAACACAMA